MNSQELQEKVENAAANVEKRKATMARHEAQLAKKLTELQKRGVNTDDLNAAFDKAQQEQNYEVMSLVYDVQSKQQDIKSAKRRLKDAEETLANWKRKLNEELEKERFLSENTPAAIIEFLDQWKEQAREWYIRAHARYWQLREELKAAKQAAIERYKQENPGAPAFGWKLDNYVKNDADVKSASKAIAQLGNSVETMASYYNEEDRLAWLDRVLEQEKKTKLYDLIQRIHSTVGTILDATGLSISPKGNLDGIVTGEHGRAKIETIGAGGWNIQCFHFRTLVHKLKD
jgi:Multidrug resistance efflux pump